MVQIPSLNIHLSGNLFDRKTAKVLDEKINLFHKRKLLSADYSEIVGVLSGYELITTNESCGGFCDGWKKQIAIRDYGDDWTECLSKTGMRLKRGTWEMKTLFHELAHSIQFDINTIDQGDTSLLSQAVQLEWQAEGMAYHLYKNCIKDIPHTLFDAYFDLPGLLFLKNWYSDWRQNDLNI